MVVLLEANAVDSGTMSSNRLCHGDTLNESDETILNGGRIRWTTAADEIARVGESGDTALQDVVVVEQKNGQNTAAESTEVAGARQDDC